MRRSPRAAIPRALLNTGALLNTVRSEGAEGRFYACMWRLRACGVLERLLWR